MDECNYRSSSQQYFVAHPQESKEIPDRTSGEPPLVPPVHLVKAQEMGLTIYPTFSYLVVHFEDTPAECIARVGQDQTNLLRQTI